VSLISAAFEPLRDTDWGQLSKHVVSCDACLVRL